jgi:hypothetical protein
MKLNEYMWAAVESETGVILRDMPGAQSGRLILSEMRDVAQSVARRAMRYARPRRKWKTVKVRIAT